MPDEQVLAVPPVATNLPPTPGVPPIAAPPAAPPPAYAAPAAPQAHATQVEPDDDDEEEEPVRSTLGKGGAAIPPDVISEKLRRTRERTERDLLKKYFGTSDPAEVARIRAGLQQTQDQLKERDTELAKYRQSDEEKKRAEMSEIERISADLVASQSRVAELENELKAQKTEVLASKQAQHIDGIARKYHVKEKNTRHLRQDFKTYWGGLTGEQRKVAGMPVSFDRWVRNWAKENPELLETAPTVDTTTTPPATATPPAPARPAAAARPAPQVRRTIGTRPAQQPPARANVPAGTVDVMKLSPKDLDAKYKSLGFKGKPYS